jgi:hypothetical protein
MEDTIANYINLAKIQLFLPNYRSRKIRLADLDLINETAGDLRYSLISHDHGHPGIASYTFVGFTENDPITDPGTGNATFNATGEDLGDGFQLVLNRTDKNGNDIGYLVEVIDMLGILDIYHLWIWVHSKNDPACWYGLYAYEINNITEGEGEEAVTVGYAFSMLPFFASMTYDAETGEYTGRNIQDNDEVQISIDFAFNPDYIGTMGTQDRGAVSISGGTISGETNIYATNSRLGLPVKNTTGDPATPEEGEIYINTFDKKVRVYADDAWITLLDFS